MRYFWREKNAEKFAAEYEVTVPTKSALEKELIKKLAQKCEIIDVVFDKVAREKYLLKHKKTTVELSGLDEKQTQKFLGTSLAVDFLQLYYDFCDFYGLEKKSKFFCKMTISDLKREIKTICDGVCQGQSKELLVSSICVCARGLSSLCHANFFDVKKKQEERLEKEGSFYRGKYVTISEEKLDKI